MMVWRTTIRKTRCDGWRRSPPAGIPLYFYRQWLENSPRSLGMCTWT